MTVKTRSPGPAKIAAATKRLLQTKFVNLARNHLRGNRIAPLGFYKTALSRAESNFRSNSDRTIGPQELGSVSGDAPFSAAAGRVRSFSAENTYTEDNVSATRHPPRSLFA